MSDVTRSLSPDEHAAEAGRLLARAEELYLDDGDDAGPREQYPTEADWYEAMAYGQEAHERNIAGASLWAQMATAHATLALRTAPAAEPVSGIRCATCGDPDGPFRLREPGYPCERCLTPEVTR